MRGVGKQAGKVTLLALAHELVLAGADLGVEVDGGHDKVDVLGAERGGHAVVVARDGGRAVLVVEVVVLRLEELLELGYGGVLDLDPALVEVLTDTTGSDPGLGQPLDYGIGALLASKSQSKSLSA